MNLTMSINTSKLVTLHNKTLNFSISRVELVDITMLIVSRTTRNANKTPNAHWYTCTTFPAKKRQVRRSARNTKSGSNTYQRTFVVTERSNKGHFTVRNTSPITLNVKWYIYVPKTYKGLNQV